MQEDFRQAVISLCNNLEEQEGKVNDGERIENIRSNSTYTIDHPDFKTLVFEWTKKANEETEWNFHLSGIENLQLSKYGEGEKYSWHMDIQPSDPMRKLTYNVVLNDDFEGETFSLVGEALLHLIRRGHDLSHSLRYRAGWSSSLATTTIGSRL